MSAPTSPRRTPAPARAARRLRNLLSLLLVLCAPAVAEVIQYDNGTSEERLSWRGHSVRFFHYANERLADVVQIRARDGTLLREVRAPRIVGPEAAQARDEPLLFDVDGDGAPELRLLAWSGGAYCCYTELLFDARDGVRNLLLLHGREFHLFKGSDGVNAPVQRLRGPNRRPQLVVENDAIAHINGSTHGPATVLVLAWDGRRYRDATRRFPKLARERSLLYRAAIALDPADDRVASDRLDLDAVAGFYANALLAGDERAARAWLLAHDRGGELALWLAQKSDVARKLLAASRCRIGQSQARLLRLSGVPPAGACRGRAR